MSDFVNFYGEQFTSRLLIGTALYPSPATMTEAIKSSEAEIVTVGLRRQSPENAGGQHFWQLLKDLNKKLLPNTAGCESAKEAITLALMARDLFDTPWIKLEVIGDNYNLQPDPFETVIAAEALIKEGFSVFPYCTDDLVFCQKLVDVGCQVLMPWAAPIGTGKGLINPYALEAIRHRFSDTTLVVDAGIGLPSHALEAMQIGYDAILLNTAVAKANDPAMMAEAFRYAVHSGRLGYLAGPMSEQQTAQPSTPVVGKPFWHQ